MNDAPGALEPSLEFIENRTFDEIQVGDSASLQRTLGLKDIQLFAIMSGDVNPAHVDPEYAASSFFHEVIAHGMWGGSLISTVLGVQYPGPGTVYIDQTLHFSRPVTIGDTLTVTVTVKEKFERTRHVVFDCQCVNQEGRVVIRGLAEVLAPTEKVKRRRARLPELRLHDPTARYQQLLERCRPHAPITLAVANPCDRETLKAVAEAAKLRLAIPVLVGPRALIEAAAADAGVDITGFEVVDAPAGRAAALRAVELAGTAQVEALMKGSPDADDLLAEILAPGAGLQRARRLSHVFCMDVPSYPKPLLITDAAVNMSPDLEAKADIVQNAIDLALALSINDPKVAILAAAERVDPRMRSTIEAAALCKMAERGQIRGGVVDGPLALDNAVSLVAAKTKGIASPVAGQADILVAPDLESCSMLARQLQHLADAAAAGIVVGARVPIVLSGRADPLAARVASCAIALLIVRNRRAPA